MPMPVHALSTSANCPHGGKASLIPTSSKVLIAAQPVMLDGDLAPVAGCAFMAGNKPQPCVMGKLMLKASKVLAEGRAVMLHNPSDLCESAEKILQGPLVCATVQTKLLAT